MPLTTLPGPVQRVSPGPSRTRSRGRGRAALVRSGRRDGVAERGRRAWIAQRRSVLAATRRSSGAVLQGHQNLQARPGDVVRLQRERDCALASEEALQTRLVDVEGALRVARAERADALSRLEEQRTVEFDLRRSLIALGVSVEQQTRAIQQELEQARAMNQALMRILERQIADLQQHNASVERYSPPQQQIVAFDAQPWYRRLWLRLIGTDARAAEVAASAPRR